MGEEALTIRESQAVEIQFNGKRKARIEFENSAVGAALRKMRPAEFDAVLFEALRLLENGVL